MKKIIMILSVLIVLVIGFLWKFHYISRDGEFSKMSHGNVAIESFDDGKAVYIGYNFRWEGTGNPTIERVELIKKDGNIVTKVDDDFRIEPFIATGKATTIGSMSEESVLEDELDKDLIPIKGFKVDKDFQLVLRVKFNGANIDNDIEGLRITYKKYGVTQFQNIPFEHILIHDDEND
ncbi:hypothetical protein [Lederbergia citri]|uniref:Uncharacterized protein n=1 Tax=Lederbergia citri TaxID=2833580 RepID=A0A942TI72_9BACI|nr:hypothetical protein [Lederbergia citri]MBS4196544.1 hypothetical protein [Lederbergia citri]